MALPKIAAPTYTLKVPSTGETVEYRPYLVKEEKILMLAMESNDKKQMITALRDVVLGCTSGKVNVEKLSMFDLEYIFLKLRTKSVGETSDVVLACSECGAKNEVTIPLDQVEIVGEVKENEKVQLTDKIGVVLRYPSVKAIQRHLNQEGMELTIGAVASAIESIYDDENVYPTENETEKELIEFLDSLTADQFKKIAEFFESMPKLRHNIDFKCKKCGHENNVALEGLQNFF